MPEDSVKMYRDYIEINSFDGNNRWSFSSSIKPQTFGEMQLKIQEAGEKHGDSDYFDL